jgi:hypothetical protein
LGRIKGDLVEKGVVDGLRDAHVVFDIPYQDKTELPEAWKFPLHTYLKGLDRRRVPDFAEKGRSLAELSHPQ